MKENDPNEYQPTRAQIEHLIWENAAFEPAIETVAVEDALGRVLAQDIASLRNLPTATTCRWDGIAVRYDDLAATVDPVSGQPQTASWQQGRNWTFGNTGIALPAGFDTLVRIEDVEIDDAGRISFKQLPSCRGEYTTPAGTTMHAGDALISAHTVLSACHLGLAAMGGHAHLQVYRKPTVAIIPSGNELVGRSMPLPVGKNVETNSLVLAGKARSWGAEPLVYPIVPDDFDLLLAALNEAAERADIVLFNAGSSKGTDDHAEEVLQAAGRLFFHRTSYGPGNHTGYCLVGRTPVLALVGVPVGADFNADWYGSLLVSKYYGIAPRAPHRVEVELQNGYTLHNFSPVQMYVRATVFDDGGTLKARILGPEDGFAATYADANAYILIEPEWGGVSAGQTVQAELRLPWASTVCDPLGL